MCIPKPTRSLHENDILQTLDRKSDRDTVLEHSLSVICERVTILELMSLLCIKKDYLV